MRRFLPLGFLLVCAGTAAAGTGLEYTPPTPPAPPDPAGLVVRLVGLSAGLVALGAGVVWVSRRVDRIAGPKGDGGGRMIIEGSLVIDRRSTLHLLRVDGRAVAVTTDATGVRSIVVLSESFGATLEAAGGTPETEAARAA